MTTNPRSNREVVGEIRDFQELLGAYTRLKAEHNSLSAKHKAKLKTINRLRNELKTTKLRLAGKEPYRPRSATAKSGIDDAVVHRDLLKRLAHAERQLKLLSEEGKPHNDKENINHQNTAQDDEASRLQRSLKDATNKLNNERNKNKANLQTLQQLRAINERVLRLFHDFKTKHKSVKETLASTQRSLDFHVAEKEERESILADAMDHNAFLQAQIEKLLANSPRTCECPDQNPKLLEDQKQKEYDSQLLENKLAQTGEELDRTKRLLNLQLTINDALGKESQELETAHSDEIKEYQTKIKELESLLEAYESPSGEECR